MILDGMNLPKTPAPMKDRITLQKISGIHKNNYSLMQPPLNNQQVIDKFSGSYPDLLNELNSDKYQDYKELVIDRIKRPWLGETSDRLFYSSHDPSGLQWNNSGGQAGAMLLALLGENKYDSRNLCENWEDWSKDNFSKSSLIGLGINDCIATAKNIIEDKSKYHAYLGSLVARLVNDALLNNNNWVPEWAGWMKIHARGAWLLISSGIRNVTWAEVNVSRTCMLEEMIICKPLPHWPDL